MNPPIADPRVASAHVDRFAAEHLPPPALWPDIRFDLPALQYPPRLNCTVELLDKMVAAGYGDKPAFLSYRESWTYAQLLETVNRIACVVRDDLGLVPGQRVLLRGSNTPMLAACFLAVFRAGCIAVPTMPLLRARELAVIIDKAQVGAALCAVPLRAELEAAQEQSPVLQQTIYFGDDDPDGLEARMARHAPRFAAVDTAATDVCLIAFTSGTTGVPKGTMHFQRDLLAICDCFPRSVLETCDRDIFIGTPPLAFAFGLGGLLLFPLRVGGTAVLLEKATPESLLKAIGDFRATICFTAPTFYRQMAPQARQFDLSSLRQTVSAGEALPASTRSLWKEASGLEMTDGIGATEMLHIFIASAGPKARAGATGQVVPGYQACVLDEHGQPAAPGVTGRLAVRGPTGCRYLADERQRKYVHDGWNLTGDAYAMDEDGYFWFKARTDDMIISAGYNIAGPEVEDVLLQHAAVAECAVVGLPDSERGQIVKAYVVVRPHYEAGAALAEELQTYVKNAIAPYKYPRQIEFCQSLPRTETGKLQRFRLRRP